jgi:hypothetical protein
MQPKLNDLYYLLRMGEAESRNVSCCPLSFTSIWLEGAFATPISLVSVASAGSKDLQQQVISKERFKELAVVEEHQRLHAALNESGRYLR